MKVLILGSKEYPMGSNNGDDPLPSGGMELYIESLVKELKKYQDLETIVITRRFVGTEPYEEHGNIRIFRVPFKRGVYFRNPTFNLRAASKALRIDFDVAITHGDIANILGLFVSRIKKKPIIMVCHGKASEQPQYNFLLKFFFRIIEKSTYSHADAVVTHSPHQVRELTTRYDVVLPGLNTEKLRKQDSKAIETIKKAYGVANKKVILFTGRLIKVKGLEYLIKSLPMIKHPYVCLIVGDGPDRKEYENLAKKLGVNAIFTGFRKDVEDFLSFADVFVLPSVASESLSYSMLEAAYMKVPIVVTDLKILPQNCGIIIPKRDENAMAKSINRILSDKGLAKNLTENAFNYTKRFNWESAGKRYHEIIKRFER